MRQSGLDFLALLPGSIASDPTVMALAEAVGGELRHTGQELPLARLYSRLDELTEPVLSLLAWHLNVLLWDGSLDDATKRKLIRQAIPWRRIHGTSACVEQAVATVYDGQCLARPWWEYGGDPGRFRVRLNLSTQGWTDDVDKRVCCIVQATKNVRSHLDGIELVADSMTAQHLASVCCSGEVVTIWPLYPSVVVASSADAGLTVRASGVESLTVTPLAVTDVDSWALTVIAATAQAFDFVTIYPEA